jgi:hypothetical protein
MRDLCVARLTAHVRVAGSGNWGSAMAKIIGNNCLMQSHLDSEVSALLLPMLRTSGLLL